VRQVSGGLRVREMPLRGGRRPWPILRPGRWAVPLVAALIGTALSGGAAQARDTAAASTACGLSQRITQQASKRMWVISRPNAFNTRGQRLCISGSTTRPGFTILTNLRRTGAWQAYPFTGAGCAYHLCSPGTDLPKQVHRLPASANTSFSWHGPAPGDWNASYDIWLDRHDQTSTADDGDELMIWLRPNPGYRAGVIVHVGKQRYWFAHWRDCDPARICWNYTQFRFLHVVHSVRRLRIMPFIRFLEQRRLVYPSWWVTSVHAGYELVSGGKGLTTTWFDVHI
jgi:Glycosyl hydrolase family 12